MVDAPMGEPIRATAKGLQRMRRVRPDIHERNSFGYLAGFPPGLPSCRSRDLLV